MTHGFYVCIECVQITIPIFANSVEFVSFFASYRIQELCNELVFHVFDGIQTHSVEVQLFGNPFSPTIQFGDYFRMIQVYIIA